MAINYPLTFPEVNGKTLIEKITMRMISSVAMTESPFNMTQQIQDFGGRRWEAEVTLRPLDYTEQKAVAAFFASLKGRKGTFKMGNPLDEKSTDVPVLRFSNNYDVGVSSPRVTYTNSHRLTEGDYFSHDNRLYMILNITPSGQNFDFDITPPLRTSANNTDYLVVNEPVGRWRLADNKMDWDIDKSGMYSFTFSCVEDI